MSKPGRNCWLTWIERRPRCFRLERQQRGMAELAGGGPVAAGGGATAWPLLRPRKPCSRLSQSTNHREVEVVVGDLPEQPVDAISNPGNHNLIPSWLLLPQGDSGAIKRRAGTGPLPGTHSVGANSPPRSRTDRSRKAPLYEESSTSPGSPSSGGIQRARFGIRSARPSGWRRHTISNHSPAP